MHGLMYVTIFSCRSFQVNQLIASDLIKTFLTGNRTILWRFSESVETDVNDDEWMMIKSCGGATSLTVKAGICDNYSNES